MLYFEVLYIHIESSWAFPVVDNNCFCATKIHDLFNDIDNGRNFPLYNLL